MKKSKDVMDYSEDNFAIVFAAMGVSSSDASSSEASEYESKFIDVLKLPHTLSTCKLPLTELSDLLSALR